MLLAQPQNMYNCDWYCEAAQLESKRIETRVFRLMGPYMQVLHRVRRVSYSKQLLLSGCPAHAQRSNNVDSC